MNTKNLFLGLGLLSLSVLATSVSAQSAPVKDKASLNHSQVLKIIWKYKDDEAILGALQGKTLDLTLVSTGLGSFLEKGTNMVYFMCNKKAPGFAKGKVSSTVSELESSTEGEVILYLDHCGI